jgi:hypothetical protein
VARPSSFREVAGALKTIVGAGGKLLPGAAIELAPFYRLSVQDVTAETWAAQPLRAIFGGLRLSVATASDPRASAAEDAPTLVSVGARMSFDTTDPRYHRRAIVQIVEALARCAPAAGQLPGGQEGEVTHGDLAPGCDYPDAERKITDELAGVRTELATALVYADVPGTRQEVELRSWLLWAAIERRFSPYFGVGLAAELASNDRSDEWVQGYRFGARLNADSGRYMASFGGALAHRPPRLADGVVADDANWVDIGGSLAAKIGKLGIVSVGAQSAQRLDEDAGDLIVIVSIASASGEPVVTKYLGL